MTPFVIGCGSIGRRHIRNLRSLGITKILAFDPSVTRLDDVVRDLEVIACYSISEGLKHEPQSALVCSPPDTHVRLATDLVSSGCHVFIEKPLGNSIDGINHLLELARRLKRSICVGYNLRFEAGLVRLKQILEESRIGRVMSIRAEFGQYLPDWRPLEDYQESYTASEKRGGGVILDVSHEIDYVRWLGGEVESVFCAADKLSSLHMDAEDTAEITLRLKSNVIAQIHLDCTQRGYSRNCKIVGEKGIATWDFKTGVHLYTEDDGHWREEAFSQDCNEMYLKEMEHFLSCIRDGIVPIADGEEGKRVLEIALAAKQSARERREVKV